MLSDPKEPMTEEEFVKLLTEATVRLNEENRHYPIEVIFKSFTLQRLMIMKLLHTGPHWTYPSQEVEFLALDSMVIAGTFFKMDCAAVFDTKDWQEKLVDLYLSHIKPNSEFASIDRNRAVSLFKDDKSFYFLLDDLLPESTVVGGKKKFGQRSFTKKAAINTTKAPDNKIEDGAEGEVPQSKIKNFRQLANKISTNQFKHTSVNELAQAFSNLKRINDHEEDDKKKELNSRKLPQDKMDIFLERKRKEKERLDSLN